MVASTNPEAKGGVFQVTEANRLASVDVEAECVAGSFGHGLRHLKATNEELDCLLQQ